MSVFSAGADAWHNPSGYKLGWNYYETYNQVEVEEMAFAVIEDTADCVACLGGTPVSHYSGSVKEDYSKAYHYANTYQCRSGSRWYNPKNKQMEGHAHCTCDGCW